MLLYSPNSNLPLLWAKFRYLGKIAYKREDFNRAENLLLESLAGALAFDGHELAALNYDILARIQMVQNNSAQAKELFQAALRAARWPVSLLTCLASIAELFIGEGKQKEAALLTTFIINHPATTARVKERAKQLLTRLESQHSPDELEKVGQRSQHSDLDSLAAQLVVDLKNFGTHLD